MHSDLFYEQLQALDIHPGCDILIRGDLLRFGRSLFNPKLFIKELRTYLGGDSTLMTLSFTQLHFIHPLRSPSFTLETKSYAGSLPSLFMAEADCRRSSHPTNSFVAVGPKSSYYLQGHDYEAEAYEPVRKAIATNAKLLVFGCLRTSPGFTTTHVAEIDTGISRKMIAPWLACANFSLGNKTRVFRRKHGSCCSKAYSNYYANYLDENLLKTSTFGATSAITGNAQDLYRSDIRAMMQDPSVTVCRDPSCSSCNLFRYDRLHRIPSFFFHRLISSK